jgi:hypothetical protein
MADETFDLAEVLGALHADLLKAEEHVQGEARLFVSETEVEITFTVERSKEGGGGLNLKVFGVGAEASGKGTSGRIDAHRITLKLLPHGDIGVAGRPGERFGD